MTKCDRCGELNPETAFQGAFGYSVLCNECYSDLQSKKLGGTFRGP